MSSQDFVMILYYLKKLVQFFSPSIISLLLHYLHSPPVFIELLKTNWTKKTEIGEKEILFFLIASETINALDIFMLLSSNAFTMLCLGICSKTH